MEINQINLPFVLMDVVKQYIQIEAKKYEIKMLATIFDAHQAPAHTHAHETHTQKIQTAIA